MRSCTVPKIQCATDGWTDGWTNGKSDILRWVPHLIKVKGKISKADIRNVFIKSNKLQLSLSDGVIGGWDYFSDQNREGLIILQKWEWRYSLKNGRDNHSLHTMCSAWVISKNFCRFKRMVFQISWLIAYIQ